MPKILIEGAGIAGQVLHRELHLKGIPSHLIDQLSFPRDKVCGGALQWDSWEYLNALFSIHEKIKTIYRFSHFWKGKKISTIALDKPMVYISRLVLDGALNRQQFKSAENITALPDGEHWIRVDARGGSRQNGEWIGFQCSGDPVEELQMHYGRGIYLGIAPTTENTSHWAFMVKRNFFKKPEDLKGAVKKELDLEIKGSLKGTKGIQFHSSSSNPLAIGDAKMSVHPFLGLGMKHAILSAKLMAETIATGQLAHYPRLHRKIFRKYFLASWVLGGLLDSPAQEMLLPLLQNPLVFMKFYDWLHKKS